MLRLSSAVIRGSLTPRLFSSSHPKLLPLYFTKSHEWIDIEGSEAVVGITDHAQEQLGDVVFVELPEVGKKFVAGEPFGAIESVKATSDVYVPCDGEVSEVNTALEAQPDLVNQKPMEAGWLIKLTGVTLKGEHMNAEEYEKFAAQEGQ
eukprot:NODE_6132_length_569_cov_21.540724_g5967_i0.p1 GENE.NODE_6132_length_569_cov_21.540724_g5967_i0~~NODE_6132_length_569_cov_21.540724_g5967_i0.p1  ORF type:complete len:166 (-),score=43.65 NODE_6132_length_569_cov_21.540724_g5967_i0:71-517(-)